MGEEEITCYEFGEFQLDARRRSLSKNGEALPVAARNFDLLLFMVENSGRVLEHDELLDKVWAGTFVEQATLKKGISALRQILGEKPENEFIKTIPRRGYSFVTPVKELSVNDDFLLVRETREELIYEEIETDGVDRAQTVHPVLPGRLPSSTTGGRPLIKIALGSILAVGLLFSGFFFLRPYLANRGGIRFSVENVRSTRITNTGSLTGGTSVSPDGSYLLYQTIEKDGVVLWLRQTLAASATKVTEPMSGGFWATALPPDNSYIYYIFDNVADPQKSGLYKVPLLGGQPRRIAENVGSFAISPTGKRLALVRLGEDTTIFSTDTDGGDQHPVTSMPAGYRLWGMNWTPDGSALLCTVRKDVEKRPVYYVSEISADTGKEKMILPPDEKVLYGAVWLLDKSAMLITAREPNADIRQIWQYFPASQEWLRVTNDNNSYKNVGLTLDGKTIVTNQESRLASIWIADNVSPDGRMAHSKSLIDRSDDFRRITPGISNFDHIGWLANESLMYSTTEGGKETIFIMDADGTHSRPLTNGTDGVWISPEISGDRKRISFLSTTTGFRQAWRMDGDGNNLIQITNSPSPVASARILRDNSTVIYTAEIDGVALLFKRSGDLITPLTASNTGFFAVSPDETLYAVQTFNAETRKFRIELRSMNNGNTLKTFDFMPSHEMKFTPDGKNLAYDTYGESGRIIIQPIDGGNSFYLTDLPADEIFGFDWSVDGTRLAVVRGKQLNDAVMIKLGDRQ